jgi:hypothetical protein
MRIGGKDARSPFGAILRRATAIKPALAVFTYGTDDVMFYHSAVEKAVSMGGLLVLFVVLSSKEVLKLRESPHGTAA